MISLYEEDGELEGNPSSRGTPSEGELEGEWWYHYPDDMQVLVAVSANGDYWVWGEGRAPCTALEDLLWEEADIIKGEEIWTEGWWLEGKDNSKG